MAMMEHEDISNENLAGHLLVAAPYLDGAGFHHSVIFLSRAGFCSLGRMISNLLPAKQTAKAKN